MSLAAAPSAPSAPVRAAAVATERADCTHCGLPVPAGLVERGADRQFCCEGCRSVFSIIHGGGLDRYYEMRRAVEREKAPARRGSVEYDAFDDPVFTGKYVRAAADGSCSATLALDGVHCAACVWLIERLGRVVPGVVSAKANYSRSTVDLMWDGSACRFSDVARGLHALGYPASPPRGGGADESRRLEARRQLVRIGVAGALAGNVMLASLPLYLGVFDGIEPVFRELFRYVSAALGVLALAWPGRVFFRGALGALRARSPHLDVPIALALAVGGAWGAVNTVRGSGEIYFDSLASLVFLLLVGRFVQTQQQRRAADAVELLLTVAPGLVRTVGPDGTPATRPAEAVSPGDTAEVRPGETVPIDGEIVEGCTEFDEAILTGESAPVAAGAGGRAWAGAVNLTGTVRVRITAAGAETRAARLMRLVSEASAARAPVVQLADRIAGRFVVIVSVLALATAGVWSWIDPSLAVEHATALLIVCCPCALGLATPLVLSVAIGRLARAGVLVKGGGQLERLSRPGTIFLDKTGTLTTGEPRVEAWTVGESTASLVRALEMHSTHPIARAIAASGAVSAAAVESVRQTPGLGIEGSVGGRRLAVGSAAFLRTLGVDVPRALEAWVGEAAAAGATPVLIGVDGAAAGGVRVTDTLRDDALAAVAGLRRAGWRVGVLSGDDDRVVARVAAELGIGDARGRVLPEGKLAAVRAQVGGANSARGRGPVVMVGDGVNDAAALAAADVGVAVQGGAAASLDAADVSIQRGGLAAIGTLLASSRSAMRRIRLCVGVSLAYNAVAASLAVAGLIHPLVAAVLMPLSSITVVAIAASGSGRAAGEGAAGCP